MFDIAYHVQTEVLSLATVDDNQYQFTIPSYQRPYVWSDDAVLKLFDDIEKACNEGEESYFIGTVLSSQYKSKDNDFSTYELIDGQQRTTTLMLIAIAFNITKVDLPLANIAVLNDQPRLQFAIRDEVQHFLGSLMALEKYTSPGREAINENPYLKRIDEALQVLRQRVDGLNEDNKYKLGAYIFKHVNWVNNIVPVSMDLNHLFATMNTAGIQLEQSDILKAKLLQQIKTNKARYDAIWEACEHLENYFERNVRKVFPHDDLWNEIEPKDLASFREKHFTEKVQERTEKTESKTTIAWLYQEMRAERVPENTKERNFDIHEEEEKTVYCRSIIPFPLLLIHAYRIHLAHNNQADIAPRLRADRLLEIFEPLTKASEEDVTAFFYTLWQVRYQFDQWVVKWVERDDSTEEKLLLTTQYVNTSNKNNYIGRTVSEVNNIVQLQSVLNFTGDRSAHYWLTSLLGRLVNENPADKSDVITLLEQLDNELSLTTETQKEASFKQARGISPDTDHYSRFLNYLREARGTGFEHYWFQKVEYLLWKSSEKERDKRLLDYRITSRNSIEHVHPQHEEHGRILPQDILDSFGNLVLLSPGENSSYSSQSVLKKKADFDSKPRYDSLKLKHMFALMDEKKSKVWDESLSKKHRRHMLSVLRLHYRAKNERSDG